MATRWITQRAVRGIGQDAPRNMRYKPGEFGSGITPEDVVINGNLMRRKMYCERCDEDRLFGYDWEFHLAGRKYVRYSCMECGNSVRIGKR